MKKAYKLLLLIGISIAASLGSEPLATAVGTCPFFPAGCCVYYENGDCYVDCYVTPDQIGDGEVCLNH